MPENEKKKTPEVSGDDKKKDNVNTIAELIGADLDDVAAGHSSDHYSVPQ
jgi:hypothetical protein